MNIDQTTRLWFADFCVLTLISIKYTKNIQTNTDLGEVDWGKGEEYKEKIRYCASPNIQHRLFSLKLPNQIKYKLRTNHETR